MRMIPARSMNGGFFAGLASILAVTAACHQVTEYGDTGTAGIHIINGFDMTVEGTLVGIEGGRSLLSTGGLLVVAANTGMVYWIDTNTMAIDRAILAGQPFPSGYSDMALSREGTIYLIGGYNSIIEISPNSGIVLDEFTVGPAPLAIAIEPQDSFLYVADGVDDQLREVLTSTNSIVRSKQLPFTVCSIVPFDPRDEFIPHRAAFVGACRDTSYAMIVRVDELLITAEPVHLAGPGSDIAAMPDTSILLMTHPYRPDGVTADVTLATYHPPPELSDLTWLSVEGDARLACLSFGGFFVASWLGGGVTRVTRIDPFTGFITGSVDVPGYPWDMEPHGLSVAVLTSD